MERAALLSHGELIVPDHLPSRIRQTITEPFEDAAGSTTRLEDIERQTILQTLRENRFNRSEAARALGISRRALLYKLQRFRELGYEVGPISNDSEAPAA
jgi:DNA-binding NtrC family response regulator